MNEFLTPDTSLALMQSSDGLSSKAREKLNRVQKDFEAGEVERAAEEFEAVFISEMLKPMFEGIELQEPFNGGKGEEVFKSFLLQEYGKMVAKTGSIGIADHVRQELINIQEQVQNEANSSK